MPEYRLQHLSLEKSPIQPINISLYIIESKHFSNPFSITFTKFNRELNSFVNDPFKELIESTLKEDEITLHHKKALEEFGIFGMSFNTIASENKEFSPFLLGKKIGARIYSAYAEYIECYAPCSFDALKLIEKSLKRIIYCHDLFYMRERQT